MLQLILLASLGYFGSKMPRLNWKPFAVVAISAPALVYLQSRMNAEGLRRMGEDPNIMFGRDVFIGNSLIAFGFMASAIVAGYLIGRWQRR